MTALAATRVGAQRPDHSTAHRGDDWRDDAACLGMDTELFFPASTRTADAYAPAIAVCSGCPVREICLIENSDQRHGVFGGTTPEDRGYGTHRTCERHDCRRYYKPRAGGQRYCSRNCSDIARRELKQAADRRSKQRRKGMA